ncbi:MAG: hypothetical protein ACI4U5_04175 [Bacilli bacterium]
METYKRIGVNKKNLVEEAIEAYDYGLRSSEITNAYLRNYMDYKYYSGNKCGNNMRVYDGFLFIFNGQVLITVFALPGRLHDISIKMQKRKEMTCYKMQDKNA